MACLIICIIHYIRKVENIMKLTPKQSEVIEQYKYLESKYGKGNVFLRYVNDFWKIRFIIHKIGEKKYLPIYDYKINGRVIEKCSSPIGDGNTPPNVLSNSSNIIVKRSSPIGDKIRIQI